MATGHIKGRRQPGAETLGAVFICYVAMCYVAMCHVATCYFPSSLAVVFPALCSTSIFPNVRETSSKNFP